MEHNHLKTFEARTVSVTLCILAILVIPSVKAQQIIVGENVLVSSEQEKMHGETLIAADPKDPNRLLGCAVMWLDGASRRTTMVYASFDGGKNWKPTLDTKGFFDSSDPAITFGLNGLAYYSAIAKTDRDSYEVLLIYRSTNGGKTWLTPTVVPYIDREYLAADNTGGKYHGRIYINGLGTLFGIDGTKNARAVKLYSSRDGQTFLMLAELASLGDGFVYGLSNAVVLSDGTLAFLFGEPKDRKEAELARFNQRFGQYDIRRNFKARLKFAMSTDGGESLSPAITVDDSYQLSYSAFNSWLPYLAVDPGSLSFKDRLYAVWPDVRSGRSEIMFSYSADKGKTWSEARTLNDDRPFADTNSGPNNFMPVVSVNAAGVVGVMWYDRRDNADDLGWWVRFTASLDGGETWLPSVRVSTAQAGFGKGEKLFTRAESNGSTSVKLNVGLLGMQFSAADTAGMTADAASAFHPFWVDNRTGTPQVWTASVNVKGNVTRYGSADLMYLDDLSDKVTLEITDASYDRSTNLITTSVQLKNKSVNILNGPIKVRAVMLQSALGVPEVVNADNGEKGEGAVWDFSSLLKANALKPNETSASRKLIFRLSNVQPFKEGTVYKYGLVSLQARIFGKRKIP
jgi:hypothetical protein